MNVDFTDNVAPVTGASRGIGRAIARVALFLASEGSEYLTGAIVDVNGASYLRS